MPGQNDECKYVLHTLKILICDDKYIKVYLVV